VRACAASWTSWPSAADRFISVSTGGRLATKDELLAHMQPENRDDYGIGDVKVIV
jgi:hypothetical protein